MQDTLDLKELFDILWEKAREIIAVTISGFLIGFILSAFIIPPKYTSAALMYVNNTNRTVLDTTNNVNINDINASQKLVNTYAVILQSNSVLGEVIQKTGLDYTVEQLEKMLTIKSINNTEVMEISVTSKDANHSAELANAIVATAPQTLTRVVKAGSVEVVNPAEIPDKPSEPSKKLYTAISGMIFFVIAVLTVLVINMLDRSIKGSEDITKHYNVPILGEIPDISKTTSDGGYKYYGK